jgi:hypothetical protein
MDGLLAIDQNRAGICFHQPEDTFDEYGLAATRRAQQDNVVARLNIKIKSGQHSLTGKSLFSSL